MLTASHCLNQRIQEDLLIVVGAEDPFSSDLSKQGQSFSVKDFEKHSNYKNGKIRLCGRMSYKESINIVYICRYPPIDFDAM